MWQKEKKYSSIVSLAFLLALASNPTVITFFASHSAVAQSPEPSFPVPKTVPSGTNLSIDGSSSMSRINDNLKQKYEQQYPGTKVNITTNGTSSALKALIDGKGIDLAAIGRGLTPEEQKKGLEQKLLRREKIGIVVGEQNPFKGNLTNQQFAQIFRGEITDWSQLGGAKGKIRFIDRPNTSDTREAFRSYPAFQSKKFATGANTTQLKDDNTALLVKELGKDGISYAIANQISQVPGLRVLELHKTLPSNPKYPFSQPLVYVFKKNPSASITSFLGFAGGEPGKTAVEAARTAEANEVAQTVAQSPTTTTNTTTTTEVTASPSSEATTNNTNTTTTTAASSNGETTANNSAGNNDGKQAFVQGEANNPASESQATPFPWWWLGLPVAALGLLWWLIGGKGKDSEKTIAATTAPKPIVPSANAVLPVDNSELVGNTPDISGTALGTAAAIAGGGAVGAGLWSRLGNSDPEEEIITEDITLNTPEISSDLEEPAAVVMPYTGLTGMPQGDTGTILDADVPNVELPNVGLPNTELPNVELPNTELPNVELPNVELPSAPGNLLDNVNTTLLGGAAAATAAGAAAWSRFGNTSNETQDTPPDTINDEITQPPSTNYVSEALPDVWNEARINNNTSEIIVEDDPITYDVESDIQDTNTFAVDEPQTEPTWLDRITSTDNNTIAGAAGIAGVTGAGAALWSKFANRDGEQNNPESQPNSWVSDSTPTRLDLDTVADAAESPQDAIVSEIGVSGIQDTIQDTKVAESLNPTNLSGIGSGIGLGAAAVVAGTGAAFVSNSTDTTLQTSNQASNTVFQNPSNSGNAHISLTPRTPKWAYASWHVSNVEKEMLRQQGGSQMALRLYDVTGVDMSYQEPQLIQQHECQEVAEDRFVAIPLSDRDYVVELGYLTNENHWLPLTRSSIVRVFSRPHDEFWFETDAELIIHGATEPGANVSIAGHAVKLKPDGTFHLRVPFTEELLDYVMKAVAVNGDKDKTIHVRFSQNESSK
jgi:phosphate transport system substrate-binding protein